MGEIRINYGRDEEGNMKTFTIPLPSILDRTKSSKINNRKSERVEGVVNQSERNQLDELNEEMSKVGQTDIEKAIFD